MNKLCVLSVLCGVVFTIPSGQVWSEDKVHYDQVNFSVEAIAEVESDTLVAVLYTQREGDNLPRLSDQVNKTIGSAVKRSKKEKGIEVQTLSYQTHPVYKNQRLTGWRVKQSFKLESREIEKLSELIGELQKTVAVKSVSYKVSPELRSKKEERLVGESIQAFKDRAGQIVNHLGRAGYRMINMDVRTSSAPVRPVRLHSAMAMEKAAAPPTIEPGKQTMKVIASGSIELLIK